MSQPVLSFQQVSTKSKAVANLMPCRIHHNGPIDPVTPYWATSKAPDGTMTAYFRGRKLHGKTVALPEQYSGVVAQRKRNVSYRDVQASDSDQWDTQEQLAEVVVAGTMQTTGVFDEVVVWSHEAVADAVGDPYVRSIEEWLQTADKIHSYQTDS